MSMNSHVSSRLAAELKLKFVWIKNPLAVFVKTLNLDKIFEYFAEKLPRRADYRSR